MKPTAVRGTQGRPARPSGVSRKDAGVPRAVERLLREWRGYLLHQQAFSQVHVDKSIESALLWITWARRHGWSSKAGMRWAQSLIKKHARKTAQNKVSQARKFCEYCALVGDEKGNPLADVKIANGRRDRSKHWAPFSVAEVSRLIGVAEDRESSQDGRHKHRGPLCSTVYHLLPLTGLRAREARLQLWADINLVKASMVVTVDKAGRQDEIPLCAEAIAVLKAWRSWSPGERLFPSFPSKNTLVRDMKTAAVPGVGDGKKGEWHRFRKCAVRERASAGADLRNLHHFARHDDIGTTIKLYDEANVDELRAVAALMPRLNGIICREPKKIFTPVSLAPAKTSESMEKNFPIRGLDKWDVGGPNVRVQEPRRGAPKAPSQSSESGTRSAPRRPEQLDPHGSRVPPSLGCEPSQSNGAVGNWTHGSTDGWSADRVLRILEVILGIQAAAEGPGHDGRLDRFGV